MSNVTHQRLSAQTPYGRKRGTHIRNIAPNLPIFAIARGSTNEPYRWALWLARGTLDTFDEAAQPDACGAAKTEEEAMRAALKFAPAAILISRHYATPSFLRKNRRPYLPSAADEKAHRAKVEERQAARLSDFRKAELLRFIGALQEAAKFGRRLEPFAPRASIAGSLVAFIGLALQTEDDLIDRYRDAIRAVHDKPRLDVESDHNSNVIVMQDWTRAAEKPLHNALLQATANIIDGLNWVENDNMRTL